MPIAVFVSRFPLITETFILREICELERQGQPVVLVPMIREHPDVVHEEAKPWVERALFTPWMSLSIAVANLRALRRKPRLVLGLLRWIVMGSLPRLRTLMKSLLLFPKSVYLAEKLERERVGHIHAHFATHPATMARIISTLTGIPFSFTAHAHDIFVDRTLLREKIRDAGVIRAISKFNKHFLESLFPAEAASKIAVVHVGIEPERYWSGATASASVSPRLICVAALKPYKGVPFLIEACHVLADEGADFQCDVIGTGPLLHNLRRMIVRSGMHHRIRLRGALPQHLLAEEIRNADVFVLPSIVAADGQMEGIPVALMEAMAAGKAVIGTALSGVPELVEDEVAGLLVDPANSRQLASAIRRLLADADLRSRLGAAAREKILREFDLRTTAATLLEILDPHTLAAPADAVETIAAVTGDGMCGIRAIRSSTDSVVYELSTCGSPGREMIVKQHLERNGQSRPAPVRAADEYRTLERLHVHFGHGTGTVPHPLRLVGDVVLMTRAQGIPLAQVIRNSRSGKNGTETTLRSASRAAGAWLHRFQQMESADGKAAVDALAERAIDDAGRVDASKRVIARIRYLHDIIVSGSPPVVAHHGDFWPGNVFVNNGHAEVIDFEGYGMSLPGHDVAYFLLHASLFYAWKGRHLMDQVRAGFFEGYRQAIDPAELAFCRLVTALRMAAGGGRTQPLAHHLTRRRIVGGELSR